MKKRISMYLCAVAVLLAVFAVSAFAQTYMPDKDGQYSVPFTFEANNEYILTVVKGVYDQTNYIEAYYGADDSEILYFEQKASDENGNVTFGPFVPFGYYDATLIVGGTSFDEPYLAGYLSVDGVSNSADITVSGLEQSYTVAGNFGFDYNVVLGAEVFDSFGYPSVTNEEVNYELLNNLEGVTLEGNVLNISKYAKAQAFILRASAGDAVENVYVQIKRETPVYEIIKVYLDEECEDSVDFIEVKGVIGNFEPITVYVKTFDQFGDEIADTYNLRYGGKAVSQTFTPYLGSSNLEVYSNNSAVSAYVMVNAVSRPDYQETANDLFVLINSCKNKLDEDKNISENGKDVYPEEKWITQSNVDSFAEAIATAEAALNEYGKDGYGDGDYADELEALGKALNTYENAFKAGIREDLTSVSINEENIVLTTGQSFELTTTTAPRLGTTTDVLTWESKDESIAKVTAGTGGKATVTGVASGKTTITVKTRGGLTDSIEVTVVKKTLSLTLTSNVSATTPVATYGGDPVILKAKDGTKGSTDIITWTVANPDILDLSYNEYIDDDGFRWIEATVIPKSAGTTKVTVSAQFGEKSAYKNITVKMPDWQTAATPVASLESGSVVSGTEVTLTAAEGTTIYYTLDGSVPSKTNGRVYRNPISISKTLTLKAIAVGDQMFDSEVAVYEYKVVASAVKASNVVARHGDYVDVIVSVEDFGDIKEAVINVEFDNSVLDYTDDEFLCGHIDELKSVFAEPETKIVLNYKGQGASDAFSYDGNVIKMTFKVKDDVAEGVYPVAVSASIVRADDSTYDAASFDGAVAVNDYIIGDVNDDGKIGLADVLVLKQYLAGNEKAAGMIALVAADTDGDGDVDNDDVILLSKYCVGWDVKLGLKKNSNSDVRIVALSDVGEDEDGLFNYFYEVYDPFTSRKYEGVLPVANGAAKISELTPAFETGAIVKANCDGKLNGKVLANLDAANLVWIKSTSSDSMTVVPFNASAECKICANEYVDFHTATLFKDIYGKEHNSNVVGITDETVFSVIEYSNYSENTFKYGIISPCDYETVSLESLNSKKNLLCYNERSLDAQENYKTTYSDYIKAFVSIGADGNADYVIIVSNGNEAAAYNVPCESCNK